MSEYSITTIGASGFPKMWSSALTGGTMLGSPAEGVLSGVGPAGVATRPEKKSAPAIIHPAITIAAGMAKF